MPPNSLIIILPLIVVAVYIFFDKAKSSLKNDIEQDAKTFFGAKEDLSGNLVLEMQGYTIFLDYDLAMTHVVWQNMSLPALLYHNSMMHN